MNITQNNGKITVEGDVECHSCNGTGLYIGMAEKDGAAVICHDCNGTGKLHIRSIYNEFTKRKINKNVKRVYVTSAGYIITAEDIATKDGNTIHFSQAGCSYNEWLNGAKPKPIKDLHCPYQHTCQNMQNSDNPCHEIYEKFCKNNLRYGTYVSDCKMHVLKRKCWEMYDKLTKTF